MLSEKMFSKILCVTIFFLIFMNLINGGVNEWTSNGPFGGIIISLSIHSANPDILYAGCDDSGGIYKTTDGGESWNLVTSSVPDVTGWTIAVDSNNPSVVYAGDIYGLGAYRTIDGGVNWEYINTGLDETHVTCLAIKPGSTNVVYAGTGGWRFSGNGIYKSVDAGSSWTSIGLTGLKVYCLAINPESPNIMYAGTHGNGFYKSTDAGNNWLPLTLPDITITSIAINSDSTNILYVSAVSGIYKSTNSGNSWDSLGLGVDFVWSLAIDPISTNVVYAATLWGGVYKSTDSGQNWNQINTGIATPNAFCVAINPFAPNTLYVGLYADGVYKSCNGGGNWYQKIEGMRNTYVFGLLLHPDSSDVIYTGLCYGGNGAFFYESTDGGQSWNSLTPLANVCVTSLIIDPNDHDVFYAGAIKAIVKTTDHGATWLLLDSLLYGEERVPSMVIDLFTTNTVYAGAYIIYPDTGISVRKSTNSGNDWTEVGFLPKTISSNALHPESDILHGGALAIDPISSNIIYAGAFGGVYKSADGGSSWDSLGLEDEAIFSLEINPDSTNIIYAGCESGKVFKSFDSGSSWTPVDPGWSPAMITDILIDPSSSNTIYVVRDASDWHTGVHGGISMSTDDGMNWTEIDSGMTTTHTIRLAIDTTTNTLYAGTYGGGVFCYTFSTGIEEDKYLHNVLQEPGLHIFPNPFSKLTTISFGNVQGAEGTVQRAKLKIYDATGRLVKDFSCPTHYAQRPTHITWDGTDNNGKRVATGVYFCELKMDEEYSQTKKVLLIK